MNIGDIVRSKNKQGQVQIEGMIVALIKADFYVNFMLPKGVDPGVIWKYNCPNWFAGNVAVVWFNVPQRSATKEEWIESGVQQGFDREEIEKNYEQQCPMVHQLVFPLDDLEKV